MNKVTAAAGLLSVDEKSQSYGTWPFTAQAVAA
jgi:hypothetical protein